MSRAKAKGTAFETAAAKDYQAIFPNARRRALEGANDKGDIEGVHVRGQEIVLECKDYKTYSIAQWIDELEREMANAHTPFGFVLFHRARVGTQDMDSQLVLTTNKAMKWLLTEVNMHVEIGGTELSDLVRRIEYLEKLETEREKRADNAIKTLRDFLMENCFDLNKEVTGSFEEWVDEALFRYNIPERMSRAEIKTICEPELYKVYMAKAVN